MSCNFGKARRFGILLSVALLLFVSGCASSSAASASGGAGKPRVPSSAARKDLATPQDTAQAFVKALTAEDFEAVLATCAVDEVAFSYQLEEMAEYMQCYSLYALSMPASDPLFADTNRYSFANNIAKQTNAFCASLAVDSETSIFIDGTMVQLTEEDHANLFKQYLAQLEQKPWKNLQIIYMENALDNEMFKYKDKVTETFKQQAARAGGDEKQEWMIVFACGERYFMQGMSLIRYQDNWKIYSLSSAALGTTALGTAMPMEALDGVTQADAIDYFKKAKDML